MYPDRTGASSVCISGKAVTFNWLDLTWLDFHFLRWGRCCTGQSALHLSLLHFWDRLWNSAIISLLKEDGITFKEEKGEGVTHVDFHFLRWGRCCTGQSALHLSLLHFWDRLWKSAKISLLKEDWVAKRRKGKGSLHTLTFTFWNGEDAQSANCSTVHCTFLYCIFGIVAYEIVQ